MTIDEALAEIHRRHGGDAYAAARAACSALTGRQVGGARCPIRIVCLPRSRFRLDRFYLVADGNDPADRDLVAAVARAQGLASVYADLRTSSVESWCVVVASLQ